MNFLHQVFPIESCIFYFSYGALLHTQSRLASSRSLDRLVQQPKHKLYKPFATSLLDSMFCRISIDNRVIGSMVIVLICRVFFHIFFHLFLGLVQCFIGCVVVDWTVCCHTSFSIGRRMDGTWTLL